MGSIHKLIIEDDEGKTTVVPVSRGEISIGRMEGNTIRLMERNVSRKHARLLRENGSVFIEDLNSFNGVKINGERIDRRLEVREGDLVEIGDYHLALQSVEVEEEAHNRAETVVEAPRPTEAATVTGAAVSHAAGHGLGANGKNEAWRQMATLPDFSVGEDVMRDAREGRDADTANMRPAALGPPDPVVAPPSPAKASLLPPFPASQGLSSPGGLAASTLAESPFAQANAGVAALRARDDAALRTEQIQVGPARIADVPRLICVSTEYAGKDFPINRPEVVIGRVEDNDVVIEHRSVSRNHAKVMFDGRVHKIIDLQSANGILVNNEEYAITDLRKNDLIELGHVKFRFIPAGEPFVPTEDESKAMLEAGVTPPPSSPLASVAASNAPTAPPTHRPLEPPTIPHKTQLDMRNLPGRDLAGHRTEELAPSDTVEMPVHVDPSTAATITDTPIDVFGSAASLQPKIASEIGTDRPSARTFDRDERVPLEAKGPRRAADDVRRAPDESRRAAPEEGAARPLRRNDTLPEPAPAVRVGGTAARRAGSMDDDSDVRSSPAKSNRILLAVGVVALLLVGLVVAIVKLSGGTPDSGHDAQVTTLIGQGRLEEADAYWRAHWKDMSNAPALKDAIDAAMKRRAVVSPSGAPDPLPDSDPTPAATPVATPTALEPPPEGDEPAPPEETVAASPSPDRRRPTPSPSKAERPDPSRDRAVAAADRRRKLADDALRDARSVLTLKGYTGEVEAALKKCIEYDDKHSDCYYMLGMFYAKVDFRDKSIANYQRFLELDPNHSNADKVRKIIEVAKRSQ